MVLLASGTCNYIGLCLANKNTTLEINQREQAMEMNKKSRSCNNMSRSGSRNTSSANSGLLFAFTFLLVAIVAGSLPVSTNGYKIMARDTGEN